MPNRASTPSRRLIEAPAPRQRSRVSNGSCLTYGDNRSAWARRTKDLIAEFISDLGGVDNTSAGERALVRRAAVLTVELEHIEARLSTRGKATADEFSAYQSGSNALRRILVSIGIKRRAKNVTPTLGTLLQQDHQARLNGDTTS
jgi:hypothetical protein